MKMPLNVGNGYRDRDLNKKVGGAKNSQHLHFRALDLDLLPKRATRKTQERLYKVAAEMYLEYGVDYQIGLGIYRPIKGTRIHIDCGWRQRIWGGPGKRWVRALLRENR